MAKPFPRAAHWTARARAVTSPSHTCSWPWAVVGCLESQALEAPRVAPPAAPGPGLIRSLVVGRESFELPGWDLLPGPPYWKATAACPFPAGHRFSGPAQHVREGIRRNPPHRAGQVRAVDGPGQPPASGRRGPGFPQRTPPAPSICEPGPLIAPIYRHQRWHVPQGAAFQISERGEAGPYAVR